jgi:nitrous oxidase accessory protein NosD
VLIEGLIVSDSGSDLGAHNAGIYVYAASLATEWREVVA